MSYISHYQWNINSQDRPADYMYIDYSRMVKIILHTFSSLVKSLSYTKSLYDRSHVSFKVPGKISCNAPISKQIRFGNYLALTLSFLVDLVKSNVCFSTFRRGEIQSQSFQIRFFNENLLRDFARGFFGISSRSLLLLCFFYVVHIQ